MKRRIATIVATALLLACPQNMRAALYTFDSTVPAAGGCPQPNHFISRFPPHSIAVGALPSLRCSNPQYSP